MIGSGRKKGMPKVVCWGEQGTTGKWGEGRVIHEESFVMKGRGEAALAGGSEPGLVGWFAFGGQNITEWECDGNEEAERENLTLDMESGSCTDKVCAEWKQGCL